MKAVSRAGMIQFMGIKKNAAGANLQLASRANDRAWALHFHGRMSQNNTNGKGTQSKSDIHINHQTSFDQWYKVNILSRTGFKTSSGAQSPRGSEALDPQTAKCILPVEFIDPQMTLIPIEGFETTYRH